MIIYNFNEKLDIQSSKDLKIKYKHRIRSCYYNAFELLHEKEVDYYVIGYLFDKKTNLAIRHALGVKDNLIIDTSIVNSKFKHTSESLFVSAFNVYKDDLPYIVKYFAPSLIGFNPNAEEEIKEFLKTEFNIRVFK